MGDRRVSVSPKGDRALGRTPLRVNALDVCFGPKAPPAPLMDRSCRLVKIVDQRMGALAIKGLFIDRQCLPVRSGLGRRTRDFGQNRIDSDISFAVVQAGEQLDQLMGSITYRAAIAARMQITPCRHNRDFKIDQAAAANVDCWPIANSPPSAERTKSESSKSA